MRPSNSARDTTSRRAAALLYHRRRGRREISKSPRTTAPTSRLQAAEDKTDTAIKSILFNAGKTPQFNVLLGKTGEVNLKKEGKRRLVEIRFEGELHVSMSPEDAAQKQEMLANVAELQKAVTAKEWGTAQTKMKALVEKYGDRFPDAKAEAGKAKDAMDAGWKANKDELDRLLIAVAEHLLAGTL